MPREIRSTRSPGVREGASKGRLPPSPALKQLVLVAIVLVVLYAFVQPLYVVPDSSAYLAYARSLLWDRDVDFENDYARFGMVESGIGGSALAERTDTGKRGNPFGVGTAILWLPFVAVVAIVVKIAALLGADVATDGFGTSTLWAAHLATWSYLLASIALVLRAVAEFFATPPAAAARRTAALVGAFLGTPLVYYVFQLPSYSHAPSVFVTALLLYLSLRWRKEWTRSRAIILGAIVGLEGLVRTQGVVFGIVPLALHWQGGVREFVKREGAVVALYTAGAAVCFSPQIVAWTVIYGSPWHIPQGEGFLHVGWGRFVDVLLSSRHGLVAWSPVFVLAATGWVMMLRADGTRALASAFFAALGVQWFVNMLPTDWWAGWSFGARRFIDFVPFVAVGLVVFSALGRVARAGVYAVTTLNLLQWLRISTGGISGETDPGWGALWGGGFLASIARAPQALWTVLAVSPVDIRVIRRPAAVPPTLHSDPPVLFDVLFVVWALLVLFTAYKTRAWWSQLRTPAQGVVSNEKSSARAPAGPSELSKR